MKKNSTVFISGDFCPTRRIEKLSVSGKHEEIFGDLLPTIQSADLAVTNLECPLIDVSSPILKTGPALMAKSKCIESLEYANFKLLTLANNHILDQGYQGLKNTLEICEKHNIDTVGAGLSKQQARQTYYKTLGDTKIAILSFAENEWSTIYNNDFGANSLNPIENYYSIKEAKKNSGYVIVIVHGGNEEYHFPSPRTQSTYRFFIDAGADIVIGHHTHCISGYEYYNGKPIIYSLGNFIFDSEKWTTFWNIGMAILLQINHDNKVNLEIIPFYQGTETPGIKLFSEHEKDAFFSEIKKINQIISDPNELEHHFHKFCIKNKQKYFCYLEPHNARVLFFLKHRRLFPSLWNSKKKHILENLIRCEAHRDVILTLLKNDRKI